MFWRNYITYNVRVKHHLGSECIALLFDVWWCSIKKKKYKEVKASKYLLHCRPYLLSFQIALSIYLKGKR